MNEPLHLEHVLYPGRHRCIGGGARGTLEALAASFPGAPSREGGRGVLRQSAYNPASSVPSQRHGDLPRLQGGVHGR